MPCSVNARGLVMHGTITLTHYPFRILLVWSKQWQSAPGAKVLLVQHCEVAGVVVPDMHSDINIMWIQPCKQDHSHHDNSWCSENGTRGIMYMIKDGTMGHCAHLFDVHFNSYATLPKMHRLKYLQMAPGPWKPQLFSPQMVINAARDSRPPFQFDNKQCLAVSIPFWSALPWIRIRMCIQVYLLLLLYYIIIGLPLQLWTEYLSQIFDGADVYHKFVPYDSHPADVLETVSNITSTVFVTATDWTTLLHFVYIQIVTMSFAFTSGEVSIHSHWCLLM